MNRPQNKYGFKKIISELEKENEMLKHTISELKFLIIKQGEDFNKLKPKLIHNKKFFERLLTTQN